MNYKKEIVKYSKLMEEKGFVNALEGNLSILDRENNLMYITPSRKRKLFLEEQMICEMDAEGNQIGGSLKHSSEYLLHDAALKARPDCNAAIHCHAPYLTAYAYCNKTIEMDCSVEFTYCFKEIPVLPFGMGGTHDIHKGLEKLIKDHDVVLLGNHGAICVAKDMEECSRILEGAEATVRNYELARQVGIPFPLSKDLYKIIYESVREK